MDGWREGQNGHTNGWLLCVLLIYALRSPLISSTRSATHSTHSIRTNLLSHCLLSILCVVESVDLSLSVGWCLCSDTLA